MTENRVMCESPSDSALKAQIEIKAAPEKVFAAWTAVAELDKWFAPRNGGFLQVDEFDCVLGGKFDYTMVFSDGDRYRHVGTFEEINPPHRLVFTWKWDDSKTVSNDTLVTIDLEPTEAGTLLTLTHERFLTTADRDQHQEGWGSLILRLDVLLAG